MKRLLAILLACVPLLAWGYDFSVQLAGGQTAYFSYCTGGVRLTYPNANSTPTHGWDGFTKPTGALDIPSVVSHQSIDYAVVEVGPYALYGCSGITSVLVGEGVTSLGNSALNWCEGILMLYLPSTLQSIGSQSLGHCTSLAHLFVETAQPPTTHESAFLGTELDSLTLHVPCGSQSAWSAAAPWSQVGQMVNNVCTATLATAVNDTARGYVTGGGNYTPGTQVVLYALENEGFFFAAWTDADTSNPRIVTLTADTTFTALFFALRHDTMVEQHIEVQRDTIYLHDTVTVRDTVNPTFFRLRVLSADTSLGFGVGSALLPAGTEVEVCALPLEGSRFQAWSDGVSTNPRRLTLTGDIDLVAFFEPVAMGIVPADNWSAMVDGLRLSVRCAAGERLRLYDAVGRLHMETTADAGTTRITLPAAGVWMLQVGGGSARKIVANN